MRTLINYFLGKNVPSDDPFGMADKIAREKEDLWAVVKSKQARIEQLERGLSGALRRIDELHEEIKRAKGV